jgi:hypothetical protein
MIIHSENCKMPYQLHLPCFIIHVLMLIIIFYAYTRSSTTVNITLRTLTKTSDKSLMRCVFEGICSGLINPRIVARKCSNVC